MAEPAVELASSEDEESEEECEIGYEQLDTGETTNDATAESEEQPEGYVLLTQEDDEQEPIADEKERGDVTPEAPSTTPSQPAPMAEKHVDAVKNAMAGFVLPPTSVPGWAKDIPESVWKQELLQGLRTQTKPQPR